MKQFKLFFACALLSLFSVSMWGAEELKATLDFTNAASDWGIPTTATIDADTYTHGDYTISLYGGTVSSKGYKANSGYLLLGQTNATLTLPAFSWTTTKIIVYGNSGASSAVGQNIFVGSTEVSTATTGATSSNTYEIASGYQAAGNVYVLKVTTKHNTQITSIEIYGETSGGTPTCATPTFSPAAGAVLSGTEVTISTTTDGATIHYTVDGTDPTTSSPTYTSAITIDAAKTIKAIAVKDSYNNSAVATAAYTIATPKTIAQVLSDISTTEGAAFLLNDVTVTYANGSNVYVKDATGYIMVYSSITGAANGKVLQGLWGKAKTYNGLPEISTVTTAPTVNDGAAVDPEALTAYPTDADLNKYVTLEDVTFAAAATLSGSVTNTDGTFDGSTLVLRNAFKLSGVSVETGKSYRVVGVVQKYNTTYQVFPISIAEIVAAGAPEAPTFSVAAGTYTSVQTVELECATAGATIYYTTNGDTPDNTSTPYTGAITVDATMTIKAIAIKESVSSSVTTATYTINLPVSEETQKTWDLTIASYDASPTEDQVTWSATYVSMVVDKHNATTKANNYLGGDANSRTSSRFYQNSKVTITPSGKQITTIVFTATSTSYATAFQSSAWTNATAIVDGTTVTVTATDGESPIIAVVGGTCGFSAVQVNYVDVDPSKPATPTFTPAAGTYTSAQSVTITTATDGATIYYTTNGDTPDNTSTPYTGAITVDETMTIKAIAIKEAKSSSVAEAAYTINLPVVLTTMQAIYDKATAVGSTLTEVQITFNNWVVSAISTDDKNIYVTDGTMGFVIYDNTAAKGGFAVNDKLNGTVTCNLKLYRGFADVDGLKADATGLTVTHDGVVTPVAKTIDQLSGVNTGAPIIVNNVKFDGSVLTDGANEITPYTTFYADAVTSLEENKYYNVTGIYVHFNTTKQIAPRSAADIEELASTAPTMTWYVDNLKSAEIGASHTINVGDAFAPYFETNSTGELTYSSTDASVAEINATTGELTLKGVVGTTVISCAVAADATYAADSKAFTLNVIDAVVDNVVILVQYNDGVEDKWLAMNHDKGAVEVNYSAGKIWDLPAADQTAITWKRTVDGDNVTFQDPSNDNYLKGGGSTTLSVAAGTTGAYQWSWDAVNGYYTTNTSGTIRTFLYKGDADIFKNYAVGNAGTSDYSELPVVTTAVFDATPAPTTYEVTYVLNGGVGDVPTQAAVAEGTVITLASATGITAPTDKEFDGWLCDIDAVKYAAGADYTMTAAATTFTAQWKDAAPSKDLVRGELSVGKWGTLCPKQNVENVEGATFYQIAYLEEQAGLPYNMVWDAISGTTLEAGQPYFFIATGSEIRGNKTGAELDAAGDGVNGLYGYIGDASWELPYLATYDPAQNNTFVIYDNSVFWINKAGTMLRSERCYIKINATVPSRTPISPMPGRDRIRMSIAGVQTPTAVENLNASETPVKLMINGQLFILRGEKMYDAQGRLVK